MLIRRAEHRARRVENCHEGTGRLWMTELLANDDRSGPGFAFVHEIAVEPGATIGEHTHRDDEELYAILSGHGSMTIDGEEREVGPGDMVLTRDGHSHALVNGPSGPMRLLVICARI